MRTVEGETWYTGKLIGGPGHGETIQLGYPPLPMIAQFEETFDDEPSHYHVYARKLNTTEYHHIQGCCNKHKRGMKK